MRRRLARALADMTPMVELPPRDARPALLAEAVRTMELRCFCPECVALDRQFPGEGYQLALFPYVIGRLPR